MIKKKTGKMIYPFKELHANKKEVHVCIQSYEYNLNLKFSQVSLQNKIFVPAIIRYSNQDLNPTDGRP